jgi:hypothetical protein
MKSLDRQSLEEQTRLVSRYVAGDLSRSERAEFEAWLVASPELASEVEMERRLRRGIASAARRGWLNRSPTRTATRDRQWRMAIAASLISAVGMGVLMLAPRADRAHVADTREPVRHAPLVATRSVQLASVRGVAGEPDIEVSRANAPGELVVRPDVVVLTCEDGTIDLECPGGATPATPQYPEYEIDLVDRGRATLVSRSPRQTPVAGDQLAFTVPNPGSLRAGDYDLLVRGHASDHEEVVGRFVLRITQ